MRCSGLGSHQAQLAEQAQQHGHEQQPDERGVQQDGDAEDDAHLLGRQRPGEREGEEHRDHHRGGGEDDAAGVRDARRPSPRWGSWLRSQCSLAEESRNTV